MPSGLTSLGRDKRKQGKPKSSCPLLEGINSGAGDMHQNETKPIYNGKNSVGMKENKNKG